ncbi:MAG: glutathione synthase [Ruminococcus sp.]|nr:glutathione synthase [Ruminococcus sp.]
MINSPYYFSGSFGIERETLRTDRSGRLAQTPHPFESDCITRDFCENQIELITPVCSSIDEALDSLAELDQEAREVLGRNGERIWLYSNPPHIETEDDIPIAAFDGSQSSKRDYRENLQRRYGKRLMLYSGIHFNFSFRREFIGELHSGSDKTLREFTDELYMKLYRLLIRNTWLIVLLTAASPLYDISFDRDRESGIVRSRYSSMRNSERGYWNEFVPVLDCTDLRTFTAGIQRYVDKGMLFSASELYLPVRLKPRGSNSLQNLAENGIDHIELRMFDLDPLHPLGIDRNDLAFAHLLMLYLISLDDTGLTGEEQLEAVRSHQAAALYDISGQTVFGKDMKTAAEDILSAMSRYFSAHTDALEIIGYEREKLSGKRPCERITDDIYRNLP